MPAFDLLYFLDNPQLSIMEVKLVNLSEKLSLSEKYQWVKYQKETQEIIPLTFGSMDSSQEIEERYFDQGFLKFNCNIGTFIEKYNSAQHPLKLESIDSVPTQTINSIENYLMSIACEIQKD
jgi:hypothetical protein